MHHGSLRATAMQVNDPSDRYFFYPVVFYCSGENTGEGYRGLLVRNSFYIRYVLEMFLPAKPETLIAGSRLFDDHRSFVDGMAVHACQSITPLLGTGHGDVGEIFRLPGMMVLDDVSTLNFAERGKECGQFPFGNVMT